MSGRIDGSRRASMDLPAPGEPMSRILCPPAAAISSARLTFSCPMTSEKSGPVSLVCSACHFGWGESFFFTLQMLHERHDVRHAVTVTPSASVASAAFAAGT